MKGKRTWKRWMCAVVMMAMLCVMPKTVFSAQDETVVEWTYDDSIFIKVEVDESRAFLPEDFPGIECKKVFVLDKRQNDDKNFEYKLVLLLKGSGDKIVEEAISKVEKLPMVAWAKRNEEYLHVESVLRLNQSCIYLAVGETSNLFIKDLDLHMPKEFEIEGLWYTLNLSVYNPDSLDKDSFASYGISRFWPDTEEHSSFILSRQPEELEGQKSTSGRYYGISKEGTKDIFDAATRLASSPKFLNVFIVDNLSGFIIVTERESWNIKDQDIAECSLSGGSMDAPDIVDAHVVTSLNQNAAIQGLKPGITTLTCERRGRKGIASGNCTVIVYEPGSKNNPGDIDHDGMVSTDDALLALKNSVGLCSIDEADKRAVDLNQDNEVDEQDALLMLKIAVGCL